MKNLSGLMKQASQMQAKMQAMQTRLEASETSGVAGAGLVRLTLSGKGELKNIKIDPKLLDPAEVEMLEDLIMAAHQDAKRQVEATAEAEMKAITGGLNIPGLSF